ncbi:MAG: hypothetical protein LEGION0398_MBIBDBAK_00695 [Legionellaceae bacterium]
MTLKPIVASLFLLGLASSPAFAATQSNAGAQAQLDAMKDKIAKMEAVLQQNQSGGFQQSNDWFNRITLSGELNADGLLSNGSMITDSGHYSNDLNINNANLYVDFVASNWTKGHVALAYQHRAPAFSRVGYNGADKFGIDEGYVTIGNFAKTPFFLMAGKQYINFGNYNRFPMVASLPQLLEETSGIAARVGFVDASGFNASASIFRGNVNDYNPTEYTGLTQHTRTNNFAVNVGFANQTDNMGYRVGASYLRNMADVNYVSQTLTLDTMGNTDKVGAVNAYASLNSGPFDASVNYVTALQKFNVTDIPYVENDQITGAKPSAWSVEAGYSFMTLGHQSRIGAGYEGSKQASFIGRGFTNNFVGGMPKSRYEANYTVNISKYTDFGFQVNYDRDYKEANIGTARNTLTGIARLAVKFA